MLNMFYEIQGKKYMSMQIVHYKATCACGKK